MEEKELKKYFTQAFSSMREKSKRRGHEFNLSKPELINWLKENGVIEKWEKYIKSGKAKELKPSIDRIDDYRNYSFQNMQLITWGENHKKGVNSIKHHVNAALKNKEKCKKVFHYDVNINLISVYNSLSHASEKTGIHSTDIARVCTGKRKQSHGFYFSYEPLGLDFRPKKHKLSKKVVQMDLEGNHLKIWDSITELCSVLNLNHSSVSAVCRGRLNKTGAYRFKFALTGEELTIKEQK